MYIRIYAHTFVLKYKQTLHPTSYTLHKTQNILALELCCVSLDDPYYFDCYIRVFCCKVNVQLEYLKVVVVLEYS